MSTLTSDTIDSTIRHATPADAGLRELKTRLQTARQRQLGQRIGACLASAFAVAAVCLAASATADLMVELATVWRATWITCVSGMLIVGLATVWTKWIAAYTLSDTAVDAERRLSQFGQRLRTTLDYDNRQQNAPSTQATSANNTSDRRSVARPAAASPSLLRSLHNQTSKLAEETEWGDAVDPRPLVISLLSASVVVIAWIAALIAFPEFRTAAARSILIPLEYTSVTFSPQTATIRPGESVTINANVSGRPVLSAQLRHRPAGSEAEWVYRDLVPALPQKGVRPLATGDDLSSMPNGEAKPLFPLDFDEKSKADAKKKPTPLHGEFTLTLAELTNDTEFEVIAGPRTLPSGSIRVLQPLTLEKSEARINPPKYVARADETVDSLELKVLEGSTVELILEFNRPASQATLLRSVQAALTQKGVRPLATGGDSDSKPNGEGVRPRFESKPVQVPEQKSPAPDQGPNQAVSDQSQTEIPFNLDGPVATVTLADLRTSVSFSLSARTEDGMLLDPRQVNIRVQRDRKPEVQFIEPPEELVVTPTTEVEMIVEARDDLALQKVGVMYQVNDGPMKTLIEQDAVDSSDAFRLSTRLLLEEHDLTHQDAVTYYAFAEDNYFGQPRRTTTALRFIDIRPYKLAFQVIDQKGGSCNGSVTLEELITRQRQGLSRAFQASEQPLAKDTMTRLSESEDELLDATIEFAAGLEARGAKVPTLNEAAAQMETAIQALDAMKLDYAISAEQQALAALIRTRENVRKKLNQADSQSASACRKFDREQRQKLRMPEKKKSDQQQQVAQARQKLEELAKREHKWSEQAQQCCSNSSSSSGKPSQSKPSTPKDSQAQSPQSPQDSSQPSASEEKSEKPTEEVATDQEQMQAELAEIQKQLEKLNQTGQSAQEQARQAAESMKQGLEELKKQDGNAAAKEGKRSAEQLEQLSAHLAAMNARDFGQRLDEVQKLAQQLAGRQESLEQQMKDRGQSASMAKSEGQPSSGSTPKQNATRSESPAEKPGGRNDSATQEARSAGGLARDQKGLAAQTYMLADLLDHLKRDASLEAGGVRQKLEQAQAENPPREIAEGMNQVAEDLQTNRSESARRGATQAKERLRELSDSLGTARAEYAQPQLKELMVLEEQLAQLQQQMKRLQEKGSDPTSIGQKWEQLEPRLDKMAGGDKRLAKALSQLREGPKKNQSQSDGTEGKSADQKSQSEKANTGSQRQSAQFAPSGGQVTPEGFYSWLELEDNSGIRNINKVLQTRIQEAILAGALMDANQPVPPAYKELVEKYYRALSDDLR